MKSKKSTLQQAKPPAHALHDAGHLLTKKQLRDALGLISTRIVDGWVRKRMIPVIVAGHRSRFFDLQRVRAALDKFERRAIGQ